MGPMRLPSAGLIYRDTPVRSLELCGKEIIAALKED